MAAALSLNGTLSFKRSKEIKKLQQLEEGAFDASTFNVWQNKMMTMDTNNKLAHIERRKIDSQLTHEQAIIAKHEKAIENRKKVESMREEAVLLMEEYMKDQLVAEERRKHMVQRVQDTHENAKEAKTKMQQFKAKIVQQVVEESKELMRQALEEAEREMKERMVLIRQIRAMEAVPTNRNKLVDFTTTGGFGFLSEMSIMELNERITLLRIQKGEEEEDKRDQILALKQANDEKLLDALATISRHRSENTRAAAVRFEAKKKTRNNKPGIKDEKLQELQRQLEEKRALRMRQQQTTRIEPPKQSAHRLKQLGQDKKSLEERRWRELELTRQRTSRMGPGTMLFT